MTLIDLGRVNPGEPYTVTVAVAGVSSGDETRVRAGGIVFETTAPADDQVTFTLTDVQSATLPSWATLDATVQWRAGAGLSWELADAVLRTGIAAPGAEATPPGVNRGRLDDLLDVDAGSPTDEQVLTWDDATERWVAADAAGGGTAADVIADPSLHYLTGANVQAQLGQADTQLHADAQALSALTTTVAGNGTAIGSNTSDIATLDGRVTVLEAAPGADELPRLSWHGFGLERVAARVVHGRTRMAMVGDSLMQADGFTTGGLAGSRFFQAIARVWKPLRWRGLFLPMSNGAINVLGAWSTQSLSVSGVTVGAACNPGQNVPSFNAATPLGFHGARFFARTFGAGAASGAVARAIIDPGGSEFLTSLRNPGGAHAFLEQGATFRWEAQTFAIGDLTTDLRNIVPGCTVTLSQGNAAFGWTGLTSGSDVPTVASGEVESAWSWAEGTLDPCPVITSGSTYPSWFQGPQAYIEAPGKATWGSLATAAGGGMFVLGGVSFERTDVTDGLFVAPIASGGWRAGNHRYQPSDENSETEFTPGEYQAITDDAIRERIDRHKLDTVMLCLGSNDAGMAGSGATVAGFKANVLAILARWRTIHAAAQLADPTIQDFRAIIVACPDHNGFEDRRQRMAEFVPALREIVTETTDVGLIDLAAYYQTEHGLHAEYEATLLANDDVHQSEEGGREWARATWRALRDAA